MKDSLCTGMEREMFLRMGMEGRVNVILERVMEGEGGGGGEEYTYIYFWGAEAGSCPFSSKRLLLRIFLLQGELVVICSVPVAIREAQNSHNIPRPNLVIPHEFRAEPKTLDEHPSAPPRQGDQVPYRRTAVCM